MKKLVCPDWKPFFVFNGFALVVAAVVFHPIKSFKIIIGW